MKQLDAYISRLIEETCGTWGIVIEDLDEDKRWEWNTQESFLAESIIKIPVMAAAFTAVEKKQFHLHDYVCLKKEDMVGGTGVLQHLTPGVQLTIYDLITLMIIQSDNTATNIVIDLVGMECIQETLEELGMEKSQFHRKMMIYPVHIESKNVITADDASTLLKKLATGTFRSRHACEQMIQILKKQQICNGLSSMLPSHQTNLIGSPPGWEFASKSGWDDDRQHDIGILYTGQRTFTISALSKGGNSLHAKQALGKIGLAVFEYAISKK
ncbi:class A beta-lactamase-related serine hydrolase [Aneurinibacillus migulanus]|uniref:serine hydrolase n=1 Tax=Aneurinibacillus migulanus TaxID=47500 RepID=UPI002E1BB387|nr:class A beta-lactamase-related serine hydrolase [Aneurinibacillus migulanus]